MGTVIGQEFWSQVVVVSLIALAATIGVYGIVAIIVRMDEMGYKLIEWSHGKNNVLHKLGNLLVLALPRVIQFLSIVGTLALLFVSGGIFLHQIPFVHHYVDFMPSWIAEFLLGLIVGIICVGFVMAFKKIFKKAQVAH